MRHTLVLVLLVSLATPVFAQADRDRRDGNWWMTLDGKTALKVIFALGLIDGIATGYNFTLSLDPTGTTPDPWKWYDARVQQFASHVTAGQLQVGLDDFYADYKNRSIRIPTAVYLVLNSIAGTPKANLDVMIEKARREAQQ